LPNKIAGKANLNLIFKRAATKLPVQTPAPGKGMANKIKRLHAHTYISFHCVS